MLETGYIKMFRKMLSWEWYQDANTARLFMHLLLTVSIKDDRWKGVEVPKGSRVTSIPTLSKELKLTNQEIRTAIAHLTSTGEITRKAYNKFSVISIVKWSDYQVERQAKQQSTNTQANSQATVNQQQYKNIEEDIRRKEAAGTVPLDADGPPPKGTPEYERWRNQ